MYQPYERCGLNDLRWEDRPKRAQAGEDDLTPIDPILSFS